MYKHRSRTYNSKKNSSLVVDDMFYQEPSSDESRDLATEIDITDLYKSIGAPNPIEKNNQYSSEVKTAYKLNFKQLPTCIEELKSGKKNTQHTPSPEARKTFKEDPVHSEVLIQEQPVLSTKRVREEAVPEASLRTLFTLYPEGDKRLVYKKYANQGDWMSEQKGFANYLINVSKIDNSIKIQYKNQEENQSQLNSQQNAKETLHFEATFESGNLYSAYKISDNEYDLILQNDINTRGHTQWFFFAVTNCKKNSTVTFNIMNLLKPDSLFNEGMQPVVFSTMANNSHKKGWHRAGFDISYYKNNITREGFSNMRSYHTLTFTYTFAYSQDTVYFAHCFPYTFSRLNKFLTKLTEDPVKKKYISRKILCQTLASNDCEYLTISSGKPMTTKGKDDRIGIVLTARQHPGESLSSYMMQGVLEFLTSEEEEAQIMRDLVVFKIVPMLNPDGVIHGNYRASLCGSDLNRRWKVPKKVLQPSIYYTKKLIRDFQKSRPLQLFCDFHGHSRKRNVFFYGNSTQDNPLGARVFPLLLSKLSKYVSFEDSRFVIEKAKESTARVALWKELRLDNIFTLEASFHGYEQDGKTLNFTEEDYINIGKDFCKGLYQYLASTVFLNNPTISKGIISSSKMDEQDGSPKRSTGVRGYGTVQSSLTNIADMKDMRPLPGSQGNIPKNKEQVFNAADLMKELTNNKDLIKIGFQNDDSGSDSNPSEDEIPPSELNKILPNKSKLTIKKPKKKIKKALEKIIAPPETTKKPADPKPITPPTEAKPENPQNQSVILKEIPKEAPKEEKQRPNSAKLPTFRIKNFKKTTAVQPSGGQQLMIVNAAPMLTPTREVTMTDSETQTEEKYFSGPPLGEEPQRQQGKPTAKDYYRAASYQKEFKHHLMAKNFGGNKSSLAMRSMDSQSQLAGLSSLAVLSEKAMSVKAALLRTTAGNLFVKGAKMESEGYRIEQYYNMKDQACKGTTTELEIRMTKTHKPNNSGKIDSSRRPNGYFLDDTLNNKSYQPPQDSERRNSMVKNPSDPQFYFEKRGEKAAAFFTESQSRARATTLTTNTGEPNSPEPMPRSHNSSKLPKNPLSFSTYMAREGISEVKTDSSPSNYQSERRQHSRKNSSPLKYPRQPIQAFNAPKEEKEKEKERDNSVTFQSVFQYAQKGVSEPQAPLSKGTSQFIKKLQKDYNDNSMRSLKNVISSQGDRIMLKNLSKAPPQDNSTSDLEMAEGQNFMIKKLGASKSSSSSNVYKAYPNFFLRKI